MAEVPKLCNARPYVSKRKRKSEDQSEKVVLPKKPASFSRSIFLMNGIIYENSLHKKPNAPSKSLQKSIHVSEVGPLWAIEWCSKHSHLIGCTAGKSVKLFDCMNLAGITCVWSSDVMDELVRNFSWSSSCNRIVSCNFDKSIKIWDFMQSGELSSAFNVSEIPSVVQFWPDDDNIVLVGGQNSFLAAYDLRTSKSIKNYDAQFGNILSMDVIPEKGYFITSTDAVSRQSASHSLIVWDFATGAKLSSQIFHEKFTCPAVRVHPSGSSFLAQTNGDYIARFSAHAPYKLDQYLRYENHKVQGYPIAFDISPDGRIVSSGSCDGSLIFYKYKDASVLNTFKIPGKHSGASFSEMPNAIVSLRYHPVLPTTVAAGDWSGNLHLFK